MEAVVEKVIDETLFKKDSWFKKLLRRFKCKSSCCMGSTCSLEPEEEIERKREVKQNIMDYVVKLEKHIECEKCKLREEKISSL